MPDRNQLSRSAGGPRCEPERLTNRARGIRSRDPARLRTEPGKRGPYRASSRSVGLSPFSLAYHGAIDAATLNTSMRLIWNLRCVRLCLAKYTSKFAARLRSKDHRLCDRLCDHLCLSLRLDLYVNLNPWLFVALRMTSCRSKYLPLFIRKHRQRYRRLRHGLRRQVRR